jgi:hypothetical protein
MIVMELELVSDPQVSLVERGDLELVGPRIRGLLAKRDRIDQRGLQLGDELLERGRESGPARGRGEDPELRARGRLTSKP